MYISKVNIVGEIYAFSGHVWRIKGSSIRNRSAKLMDPPPTLVRASVKNGQTYKGSYTLTHIHRRTQFVGSSTNTHTLGIEQHELRIIHPLVSGVNEGEKKEMKNVWDKFYKVLLSIFHALWNRSLVGNRLVRELICAIHKQMRRDTKASISRLCVCTYVYYMFALRSGRSDVHIYL